MRFGEEEQLEEARAENADEQEVAGRLAEVKSGRGSAGPVPGGDERYWADETSRKGKGKGNGGKGEHEGKGGGFGHNGKQQETREREKERMSDAGEEEMAEGNEGRNSEVAERMARKGNEPDRKMGIGG